MFPKIHLQQIYFALRWLKAKTVQCSPKDKTKLKTTIFTQQKKISHHKETLAAPFCDSKEIMKANSHVLVGVEGYLAGGSAMFNKFSIRTSHGVAILSFRTNIFLKMEQDKKERMVF